ncbi:MAG: hypothetical protein ACR2J8_05560, partial [Thermomicrobiales bacterium]
MTALPSPARRAIVTVQGLALGSALIFGALATATATATAAAPAAEDAACVPPAAAMDMSAMSAATPEAEADLIGAPASEEVAARAAAAAENFVA